MTRNTSQSSSPRSGRRLTFPDDKRVLFCIGAQKGGTTWLGNYVAEHPECYLPGMKECHFFEVRTGAEVQARKVNIRTLRQVANRLEGEDFADHGRAIDRLKAATKLLETFLPGDRGMSAYIDLMTDEAGAASCLCDFTPAYAVCDRTAFREMLEISQDTRFVFILRDPVQRLWAQARMAAKERRGADAEPMEFELAARRSLRHYLGAYEPATLPRSNYARTITELEAAVPSDRILYLFYETLFSEDSLRRFCDFAGLTYRAGDFSKMANVGRAMDIPPMVEQELWDGLERQYVFLRQKFGDAIPKAWYDPEHDPVLEPGPGTLPPPGAQSAVDESETGGDTTAQYQKGRA